MKKLQVGLRKFRTEVFPEHRRLFESLAAGQRPETMFITCSDSRIDPSLATQTMPGELFVLRNAGNLVPEYGKGSGAEAASIEFAIKVLEVEHIVVCGHSHCGAMSAVLEPEKAAGLPAVRAWLETAGPPRVEGANATLEEQIRLNVKAQIEHLRSHPAVREAEQAGKITLHGWVYDFVSGGVEALRFETGEFGPLA